MKDLLSITDSSKSKKTFLNVALSAAKKAGKLVLKEREHHLSLDYKDKREVVTQVDHLSEALIIEEIKKSYPDHSFWSEERPEEKTGSEFRWVIDPIDGTFMFVHNLPTFGISIALEKNGESILGVCYFPDLDLLYVAEKGKGAFCNGSKINVSSTTMKEQRLYFMTTEVIRSNTLDLFKKEINDHSLYVKDFGSASLALCFLAQGRIDGALIYAIKPCDIAAGMLIVKEAGGSVSTPHGRNATSSEKDIIASNKILHPFILKSIC